VKLSGSVRRVERKNGRSVPSRSEPLLAFHAGTVCPGPVRSAGPGFFVLSAPKTLCTVPGPVPLQGRLSSYFIPLERKSRSGATRREFHEQGSAL
jgi:hypothetical protein